MFVFGQFRFLTCFVCDLQTSVECSSAEEVCKSKRQKRSVSHFYFLFKSSFFLPLINVSSEKVLQKKLNSDSDSEISSRAGCGPRAVRSAA